MKWSRDHKCSPDVLHAVQDLWESLSDGDLTETVVEDTPQEHLCLAISKVAVSGAPAHRSVQLLGTLQGLPITILIDSGSTSSFISASVVQQLSSQPVIPYSSSVSVAGGGILASSGLLQKVVWIVDSHSFTSDLKILPLQHFDVILGMDFARAISCGFR